MPAAVIDLHGKVLIGVGWQDVCTGFHRVNPETCQYCVESDRELSAGVPAGQYRLYQCNNHLWDVATPIIVGGKHLGNVFTGQFFFDDEKPDLNLFREQARRFGFPEPEYLAAIERVPRLSREVLAAGMAYLMKLAEMISKLSYSNLKLARSLSERERLTAALRENEERLSMVVQASDLGTWDWDLRTGELMWSRRCLQMFGLSPDTSMTYEGFLQAIHPGDQERIGQAVRTAIEKRQNYDVEMRAVWPDGSVHWLNSRGRAHYDKSGKPVRMSGTTLDITQRKRTEQSLIRSEKLASVGRMAATMAHEINNPLASAMNALYLASTDPGITESALKSVELANTELELVAHITRQTLGFYRESGTPTAVNLAEVAEGILGLYGPKLRNKSFSVCRRFRNTGMVQGIEGELRQVISNLVANSIDAAKEKATLHVRVSGPSALISGRSMVRLTIADNGSGISPENLKHIFEPFFTTKQAFGTGLGLWVTRELVGKHDGHIRVRSQVGKGTVFSIWLPVERRQQNREEQPTAKDRGKRSIA